MLGSGQRRYAVTIGAGKKRVQLPNGFAYDEGETVLLDERQVNQLDDSAFTEGYVTDLTPVRAIEVGGETFVSFGIDSLALSPSEPSVIAPETQELTATATLDDDDSTTVDVSNDVEWSSEDEDIAVVDADGVVTGVSEGAVDIVARLGGVSATVEVTVNTVATLAVTPESPTVAHEGTQQFAAEATLDDDSTETVTDNDLIVWSSDDEAIATIDEDGLATTVGEGEAEITATWPNGVSDSATLTVTV